MNIPIIFEDNDLLVVNKPAGIVVNRSETQKDNYTLQDWVEENIELDSSNAESNPDFIDRSGIVHRLDKETSGLIIIAKNPTAFKRMQKRFKSRDVKKKYMAFCYGDFSKLGDSEIIVDAPIARNPDRRQKFAVVEEGKSAITKFELVKVFKHDEEQLSLVGCFPETGRTHQIRVHLTALGFPVVGDKLYSGRKRSKKYGDKFERQYLHACELEFEHPITNEEIKLDVPLPEDMLSMLD